MSDPDRWVWLQAWRDLAEPKTSGVASYFASPKLVVGFGGSFFFSILHGGSSTHQQNPKTISILPCFLWCQMIIMFIFEFEWTLYEEIYIHISNYIYLRIHICTNVIRIKIHLSDLSWIWPPACKYTSSDIQYIVTTVELCPFKLYLRISSGIQEMFRRDPSQLWRVSNVEDKKGNLRGI